MQWCHYYHYHLQCLILCHLSPACNFFPLRRFQAFHCVSETGGGLPSGPLLSYGSFVFNEGWLGPTSHVGQWARRDDGQDHKRPTHGFRSLCGQNHFPLHVHFSGGCCKPLPWVGGEVSKEERELRWRFSDFLRKVVQWQQFKMCPFSSLLCFIYSIYAELVRHARLSSGSSMCWNWQSRWHVSMRRWRSSRCLEIEMLQRVDLMPSFRPWCARYEKWKLFKR